MGSFGGLPRDLPHCRIDCLVSSANKYIQGVPGFASALTRREVLLATAGFSRSLSPDLLAQWKGLGDRGHGVHEYPPRRISGRREEFDHPQVPEDNRCHRSARGEKARSR